MAMRMFPIQPKWNCHSPSRQEMLPHPAAFGPAAPAATGEEDFPPVLRLLTYNLFLRRARIPRKHASSLQRTLVLAGGKIKECKWCCQFGMICSVHGAHVWVGTTMTPVLGPGWYPWLSVPRIVRDCMGLWWCFANSFEFGIWWKTQLKFQPRKSGIRESARGG